MTNAAKPVYVLPDDAVWLVTGCSSGLGLSLAKLIATHPTHRIVATARNSGRLESLLPLESPRVLVVELDVTSSDSITKALDAVLKHPDFGRIDVLVNNAGYGLVGDTEVSLSQSAIAPHSSDAEHAKARAVMEANFWGVTQLTLHAMRIMRETNAMTGQQGGVVIQISSMGGFMGFPGNAWYHSAKFAVEGFTESVSREVRPEWNIHFTIAEPGGIETNYATSSLTGLAHHPAYAAPDSPARVLLALQNDPEFRKTWAKPDDMSKAIYRVVTRGKTIPIRFPLGAPSFGILREEINTMAREFDEIKSISIGEDIAEEAAELKEYMHLA